MPPLPPVENVLSTRVTFSLNDDRPAGIRNFWSYSGGAPSTADLNTFAEAYYTGFSGYFIPLLAEAFDLTGVIATDLSSDTGNVGEHLATTAGTYAGAELTSGTATVIGHTIARHYRGGKPKTFTPFGVQGALQDANKWASGYVAEVSTAWGGFVASIEGSTYGALTIADLVNVSYYHGFTASENPVTGRYRNIPNKRETPLVDVITGHVVQQRVGSQRRRLRT